MRKNNIEPQLISIKEWIKAWTDFKEFFKIFKDK
jgi:hypothetical protein